MQSAGGVLVAAGVSIKKRALKDLEISSLLNRVKLEDGDQTPKI